MIKLFDKRRVGFALLLIVLFVFNFGNIISYADDSKSDTEVSTFFIDFANKAFTNIDTLHVTNQEGEDVTNYFIDKTENLFKQNDYKAIQDLIVNEKLVPSIRVVVDDNNNDLMRASTTKNYFDYKYHVEKAPGTDYVLEWAVKISSTVVYNPNTGQIYSASIPTLTLHYTSGGIDAYGRISQVSTWNSIKTSSVVCYARYNMKVEVTYFDGDLGYIIADYDFGTYTDSIEFFID